MLTVRNALLKKALASIIALLMTSTETVWWLPSQAAAADVSDIVVGKAMPASLLRDIRIAVSAISQGADPLPVEFSVTVPGGNCVFTGTAQGHLATEKITVHPDMMTCRTPDGKNAYQVTGYLTGQDGRQGVKAAIEKADSGLLLVLKKDAPLSVLLTAWPKPL